MLVSYHEFSTVILGKTCRRRIVAGVNLMISPPFADDSPSRIAPNHVNGPSYSALNILKDIRRNYYKNNVALLVPNYPRNGLENGNKYSLNPLPVASSKITFSVRSQCKLKFTSHSIV